MKKIVFIGVCASLAGGVFAQSGSKELRNAYNHYGNEYYDKAKSAIDKCIEFEDTKADAKTWFYRGNIYVMLEVEKTKRDSNLYKKFENCGEIAYDSYIQAFNLDPKVEVPNMNIKNIQQGLTFCSNILVRDAYKSMREKNYDLMYQLANKAFKANGENPDAIYCLGLSSELLNKKNDAKSYYLELVKRQERNMHPYIRLADIYRNEEDVPNAVKTIEAGFTFFLNDSVKEPKSAKKSSDRDDKGKNKESRDTFLVDYAEAYSIVMMWAGRNEDAREIMDKALQKDPNNYTLLINYGSQLLDNLKLYDEAAVYFKRALDLKPDDILANFNTSSCYYNNYIDKNKKANEEDDPGKSAILKAEAESILQKARPYLEKTHELDPKDINTLRMLAHVYLQGEEMDKFKEVDEKLKVLRGEATPRKGR